MSPLPPAPVDPQQANRDIAPPGPPTPICPICQLDVVQVHAKLDRLMTCMLGDIEPGADPGVLARLAKMEAFIEEERCRRQWLARLGVATGLTAMVTAVGAWIRAAVK